MFSRQLSVVTVALEGQEHTIQIIASKGVVFGPTQATRRDFEGACLGVIPMVV